MALHVNLTFMILFTNIILTLGAPELVLGDNEFFETNDAGEYVIKDSLQQDLKSSNPDPKTSEEDQGFLDLGSQVFSGIFLVFDFIGLLFKILFSSLFILTALPPVVGLIVGVPVFIGYGLAIIGFIRG